MRWTAWLIRRSIGSIFGNMLPMVILPFLVYNEDKSLNGPMVFVAALVMGALGFICFLFLIAGVMLFVGLGLVYNLDKKTLAKMNKELGRA